MIDVPLINEYICNPDRYTYWDPQPCEVPSDQYRYMCRGCDVRLYPSQLVIRVYWELTWLRPRDPRIDYLHPACWDAVFTHYAARLLANRSTNR